LWDIDTLVYIRNLRLKGISPITNITAFEGSITLCKEHESCTIISVTKQQKLVFRLEDVQNVPIMHQLALQPTSVHSIQDSPPKYKQK
jgi:hypothetical protein